MSEPDLDDYDEDEIYRPCENCGIVLTYYGYQCRECGDREDEGHHG